jgi:hypothetical protein
MPAAARCPREALAASIVSPPRPTRSARCRRVSSRPLRHWCPPPQTKAAVAAESAAWPREVAVPIRARRCVPQGYRARLTTPCHRPGSRGRVDNPLSSTQRVPRVLGATANRPLPRLPVGSAAAAASSLLTAAGRGRRGNCWTAGQARGVRLAKPVFGPRRWAGRRRRAESRANALEGQPCGQDEQRDRGPGAGENLWKGLSLNQSFA